MKNFNCVYLLVICLLLINRWAQAQDDSYYLSLRQQLQNEYQLTGGEWMIGGNEDSVLAQTNFYGSLTVSQENVTGQSFNQAVRIQVDSAGPFAFSHAYNFVAQEAIEVGDILLLAVWVRNAQPEERAFIELVYEQSTDPFEKVRTVPINFRSSEWQQVFIPLESNANFAPGESHFHINVGQKKQTVELGGVAVINYKQAYTLGDLPETTPDDPEDDDAYYAGLRDQLEDEYGIGGGDWLIGNTEAFVIENYSSYGADVRQVTVEGQPFSQVLNVQVTDFGPQSFSQGLLFRANDPVAQGDVVLLVFYIRDVSGEGSQVDVILENAETFTKTYSRTIEVSDSEWQQVIIPAESVVDHGDNLFKFQLNLGYRTQEFQLGGVALLNYGDTYTTQQLPSALPIRSYEGSDPGAPWRAEAQQRIEVNRKGDLTVNVVDMAGNPVPEAQVHVAMKEHEFGFGTVFSVINARGFSSDSLLDIATYRDKIYNLTGDRRTFNLATVENMLKWPLWEEAGPDFITKEEVIEEIDSMRSYGIAQRGHTTIWGSGSVLPDDLAEELQKDNPDIAYIQRRIQDRIAETLQYPGLQGKFKEWDVINEPLHEEELYEVLVANGAYGSRSEAVADWLKQARALDSTVSLYINEYDIWTNNEFYISEYKALVEEVIAQGGPVDGLGIQAHMGSILTPIERLYAIMDELAALKPGLELSITEYDASDIENDSLAAAYLRDAMTIAFSHPAAASFVMWGIWDKIHWLGDAPLFYDDFTPKPAYYEYIDLVFNQWWTNEAGKSNDQGQYAVRGFLGEYDVKVVVGEDTVTQTVALSKDGATVTVEIATGNQLPGLIQAENFEDAPGVTVVASQDEDGTDAITDLGFGNYATYEVNVQESGTYRFVYRVARQRKGVIGLALEQGEEVLHYRYAGPFQAKPNQWIELEAYAYLEEGKQQLRIKSRGQGWKLNYLDVESVDMSLPGKIQAEVFSIEAGRPLVLPSGDDDRTPAVTFWQKGAYVEYPVSVAQAGSYTITYRLRSVASSKATFTLMLGNDKLHTVSAKRDRKSPFAWQEVTATAELPAGEHTLRLVSNRSSGSINWWSARGGIENARVAGGADKKDLEGAVSSFTVFPNPTRGQVQLRLPSAEATQVIVYDLRGRPLIERTFRTQSPMLDLKELSPGAYFIKTHGAKRSYQQQVIVKP